MVSISRQLYVDALIAGQRAALIIGGLTFAVLWAYHELVTAKRERIANLGLAVGYYLTLILAALAYFYARGGA